MVRRRLWASLLSGMRTAFVSQFETREKGRGGGRDGERGREGGGGRY
jgi:hypothetical protein